MSHQPLIQKDQKDLVDINSDKTLFYPFIDNVNKCGGSRNTLDDPYAWVCVPNKVKNSI